MISCFPSLGENLRKRDYVQHQSPHHPQSNQPHFEVVNGGPNSRPQLRHKLSYGDLLSSKRQAPVMLQKNKARIRRSRSEFRPQIQGPVSNNDENINPLNLHPNHQNLSKNTHQIVSRKHSQRHSDYNGNVHNGNCHNAADTSNSDYAELSSEKKSRRESRTNQQSQVCVGFANVFNTLRHFNSFQVFDRFFIQLNI